MKAPANPYVTSGLAGAGETYVDYRDMRAV